MQPYTKSLYNYSDYRTFLKDYFESRRQADRRWSYGVWARQLKLKSPSTLIMVVNGQRNPGTPLISGLSRYFQFSTPEEEYFENLVMLNKAKNNPRMSVLLMEKLASSHPTGNFQWLDAANFRAIANWHFYAIREMVHLRDFQEDPDWIEARLGGQVGKQDVKEAIRILLGLELLKRSEDGRLVQSSGHANTQNDVSDEGLKRYHEQILEKAREAVREVSPDRREISGTTFAIPMSKLPEAKVLIRKFRTNLCRLLETPDSDEVYQLEVAFFPLTAAVKKEGVS